MKFNFKRAMSIFMALAIVCSLAVVPASAAGGVTVTVEENSWSEDELTVDVVAASTSGAVEVSNFDISVTYDSNSLEYVKRGKETDYGGSLIVNEPSAGTVKVVGASAENSEADGKLVLSQIIFRLKADAEAANGVFSVSVADFKAIPEGSLDPAPVEGVQAGADASIKLPVKAPAVETVTLGKTAANVDGATGDSTTVKAKSAKGTDITSAVTWTVSPSGEGVTVSGGTVTVDAKAKAGDYDITAASGGKTATATLTVTRATSVITSVEIDGGKTIALSKGEGVYSAKVTDQFDDEVITDVTWTLGGEDAAVAKLSSATSQTGKSITVTLTEDAAEGDTFTLTATKDSVTKTLDIKVVQGTVYAKAKQYSGDYGDRIYIAIEDIDRANSYKELYLRDVLPQEVEVTYDSDDTANAKEYGREFGVDWDYEALWEKFQDLRENWDRRADKNGQYFLNANGYAEAYVGDDPVEIDLSSWLQIVVDEGSADAGGWGGWYEEENTYVPPVASANFTDVAAGYWAADDINWCYAKNVMLGNSATTFNPTGVTSRQQLWMVLARVNASAPDSMATARTWAINMGVSDGTNVSGSLTRQQMVAMLYRYSAIKGYSGKIGGSLSAFSDAGSVSAYARDAMSWAVANGIITGNDGRLNPNGTATRAQFAAIMHRFCDTFKVI